MLRMLPALFIGGMQLTIPADATAQHYSYITDRRFFSPGELAGYTFYPAQKKVLTGITKTIAPGKYAFGITYKHLYVTGEGIEGVYTIYSSQQRDYGFLLDIIHTRNARLRGYLKIIQNKYGMVESLVFRRSANEVESVFLIAPLPVEQREKEKEFFTDRGELAIPSVDRLWGQIVRPFMCVHQDSYLQERFSVSDSIEIAFLSGTEAEIREQLKSRYPMEQSSLAADLGSILSGNDRRPSKSTQYLYLDLRTGLHDSRMKSITFPIRKIIEKEDRNAGLTEERYRWEFITDSKEKITLFLNGDHTVSSFLIGNDLFLMRGF
ncbi:MAG: hypothetical protein RLY31_881 [Bacteroidota bacterium]|jgi:hypothetical protein